MSCNFENYLTFFKKKFWKDEEIKYRFTIKESYKVIKDEIVYKFKLIDETAGNLNIGFIKINIQPYSSLSYFKHHVNTEEIFKDYSDDKIVYIDYLSIIDNDKYRKRYLGLMLICYGLCRIKELYPSKEFVFLIYEEREDSEEDFGKLKEYYSKVGFSPDESWYVNSIMYSTIQEILSNCQ